MQVDFSVHLERHPLPAGGYLAQLTLNAPRRLNALTPEMVELLYRLLLDLRDDPDAVAVFLDGAGDRAFCSGGDALRMRESALANPGGPAIEAEAYFAREFAAAYLIHTFPKPVIVWGNGIVMSSGLGLMVGASHRIVTERSRLSMPEISIGLFPNVGAGWFLSQMPGGTGLFAGLTGAELMPADALYAGLADYCLSSTCKEALLRELIHLEWCDDAEWNRQQLTERLTDIEADQGIGLGTSFLKTHRRWIDESCVVDDPLRIERRICRYRGGSDWLRAASQGLQRGSASTAKLVCRQLQQVQTLSLAEVFRMELVLAANRVRDPEFAEGVRARLLDRDRDPRWCYQSVADVPDAEIDALFIAPWQDHPLDLLDVL